MSHECIVSRKFGKIQTSVILLFSGIQANLICETESKSATHRKIIGVNRM